MGERAPAMTRPSTRGMSCRLVLIISLAESIVPHGRALVMADAWPSYLPPLCPPRAAGAQADRYQAVSTPTPSLPLGPRALGASRTGCTVEPGTRGLKVQGVASTLVDPAAWSHASGGMTACSGTSSAAF